MPNKLVLFKIIYKTETNSYIGYNEQRRNQA